jgi:hypothetical protein
MLCTSFVAVLARFACGTAVQFVESDQDGSQAVLWVTGRFEKFLDGAKRGRSFRKKRG